MNYKYSVDHISVHNLQDHLNTLEDKGYEIIYMKTDESVIRFNQYCWLVVAKKKVNKSKDESRDVSKITCKKRVRFWSPLLRMFKW